MAKNYYKFIERNFTIKNKQGRVVPFILWNTQDKYLMDLVKHYGKDLQGIRDIILKARKEGFSSVIDAIFAVDFLTSPHPINSVIIADNKDETKKLLSRTKFFIENFLTKHDTSIQQQCETINANEIINKENGAALWIGTAGSRVALRVESVQNLHFSEAAFFQDTDIITARETIEGALQMVDLGTGKVFIESTANGYGNYYQLLETKAYQGNSSFRSVFFGAEELYSKEWLAKKATEFTTDEMFKQEYPSTREEAYISSGSKFFDTSAISWLRNEVIKKPLIEGNLTMRGEIL